MSRREISGLSPIWLVGLALVLGVFIVTAIPLIIDGRSINSTAWIGLAGSALTSGVALLAVAYGAHNVRKQLRINLLSREEERMEASLPGLREISGLLNFILPRMKEDDAKAVYNSLRCVQSDIDLTDIPSSFHAEVEGEPGPVTDESLKKVTPLADQITRQRLLVILQAIDREAARARQPDSLRPFREQMLRYPVHALFEFDRANKAKVKLYEARLARFRPEIEEYFGRD